MDDAAVLPARARRRTKPVEARLGAICAAGLALTACSYGSMVDVAPMDARARSAPLVSGDYCEVQASGPDGRSAPFTVISGEDCIPVEWIGSQRAIRVRESDSEDDEIVAAVAPVGSGVFAAQVTDRSATPPHQISLFLASGTAFAILPVLDDDQLAAVARRHNGVAVARSGSGRTVIASGELKAIHRLLVDIARASLREMEAEGDTLSLGVRDVAGAPDHRPSKAQERDIEALLKRAAALAR